MVMVGASLGWLVYLCSPGSELKLKIELKHQTELASKDRQMSNMEGWAFRSMKRTHAEIEACPWNCGTIPTCLQGGLPA